MELVVVIGLVLTILNIIDKVYTAWDKSRQSGANQAITRVDIDILRQGNAEIGVKIDRMANKMDSHGERLTRVEESLKQAHKRMDSLEQRHV